MPPKTSYPQITVTTQDSTRSYPLKPGRTTLGRRPDNTVVISDPSVSSYHAAIIISDDKVVLEDLGSTNGVFVNRKKIDWPYELTDGVHIALGSCRLVFNANASAVGYSKPSQQNTAARSVREPASSQPLPAPIAQKVTSTRAMMPASLEFLTESQSVSKRMNLDKVVNPLGNLEVGLSAISFGRKGWALSYVDGMPPLLNGKPVASPFALNSGDVITIGDMQARFIM